MHRVTRRVEDLYPIAHFKLLADDFLDSGAHRLTLEPLEGECKDHALPPPTMQLHQLKRVLCLELPETGDVLL